MVPLNATNNQQSLDNSNNFVRRRPMSNENNDNLFDVKYKVLLLGDSLVGKTSLQRFIAGKDFRPGIGSTIGININLNLKQTKNIKLIFIGIDFVNKIISVEKSKVNLQIWDTAGQRNFRTIGKSYYVSTKAFVLVYDVTKEESFDLIQQFNQLIEQTGLDMERRYLVANKIDLVLNRKVDEETGRRFALRNSMIYFETSCKTGKNVLELFEQIASDLVHQHDSKMLEFHKPVKENFAFNYHEPPITNHEIHDRTTEEVKKSKKKRSVFSSLSYESIDKNNRFNFRRFILCCKPS
ncbi:unnamed protein product [Rotaria sp. Silwood2]|nr:unnamed protein product [Rotaria sp. Silwood2]CAF2993609.1 unnamed protein product [Rotaria sp. Silwood2]CAF4403462.1 unnamed protein product [Rotaria sp. Silwood2]